MGTIGRNWAWAFNKDKYTLGVGGVSFIGNILIELPIDVYYFVCKVYVFVCNIDDMQTTMYENWM